MGRHRKKKNHNKKNTKNKQSTFTNHNNTNDKLHSKKKAILNQLQHAQHTASSQLNQANINIANKYHNTNNNSNSERNTFLSQLRPLGLGIRNTSSDGNCLFRAISDQLDGNQNNHHQCRNDIIQYMTTNATEFAPFYVGDYAAYLKKMSKTGIWGGNMELIAAAKAFKVDIVIHSLNAAKYEILYQKGKPLRSIHISYHNERHYASVRRLDDMNKKNETAAKHIILDKTHSQLLQREQQRAQIAWCHNGGNPLDIDNAKDPLIQLVVVRTGCYDIKKVKTVLEYLNGDIEAAVENIMVDISLTTHKMYKHNDYDKIKCIECSLEFNILFMYLFHYKSVHYKKEKEEKQSTDRVVCICGHSNEYDVGLCSACKWDLRFKPMIPCKQIKAEKKKKNTDNGQIKVNNDSCDTIQSKGNDTIDVKEPQNAATDDIKQQNEDNDLKHEKYEKYRDKYWICKRCTFWNYKISKECMVCSMLSDTPKYNKIKEKKRNESEWICSVCTFKNKEIVTKCKMCDHESLNKKDKWSDKVKQKKKNEFGWICSVCTWENKPSLQKCKMCGNKKPKKGRNNKKEEVKSADKWSVAGNHKCGCGSNKKYKKCCKKLEKHRTLIIQNEENKCNLNDFDTVNRDELEYVIDTLEHEIYGSNFKGKIKKEMMRELSKLKAQKRDLDKTLKSNKNRMKAKNGENDALNNNGVNIAVVNTTIAI